MRHLKIIAFNLFLTQIIFAQFVPLKTILEVEGPVNSNITLGTGIKGLGDVNGDGKPDFAVSAWNAKKTYIYYGGAGILDEIADDSIPGGGAIETGDLNGDGILDLVIKLNGDSSWVNYLAIYLGREGFIHKYDTLPNLIIREEQIGSEYGATFAIGDLNKDGHDDLVVGALNYDYKGKLYVYFGRDTLTGMPDYTGIGDTVCTNFGSVVKIGDLNGDGTSDLLISSEQLLYCNVDSGYIRRLDVFYGHANWLFEKNNYDQRFDYSNKSNLQGIVAFSLANINADNTKDIAFPGEGSKMYFIFGSQDSLSCLPDFFVNPDTNDFSSYVGPATNVGDINNDGKEDFTVLAYSGGAYCIHLFLGGPVPQNKRVAIRCKGFVGGLAFYYVTPLGDVNGDGQNDFGTTAPYNALPDNLPQDGYFIIFSGDSTLVTSIKNNLPLLPKDIELMQNYPNPFNPATTIEYTLQKATQVSLNIFDVLGKKVKSLVNETQIYGTYKVLWGGDDDAGKRVSSGTYFYRLEINNSTVTKKAVYIK
jgi:hypothetical protein